MTEEGIAILFAFALVLVLGLVLIVPVVISYLRSRNVPELRTRLEELSARLAQVEKVLRDLRAEAAGRPAMDAATRRPQAPEPVPPPHPSVTPPAATPVPTVVPPQLRPSAAQPPAESMQKSSPPGAPASGTGAAQSAAPTAPRAPQSPAARAALESNPSGVAQPPGIDWERWIGIRGAAVLGGVVLALAGLLFFQYSIQHGLISPVMRVALGVGVGLGCIFLSEWLRPRDYRVTAEGIAGAGIVCLYAAFWAAHARYGLLAAPITFVLMALITGACCLLAVRHGSQTVAVLGLVGGFATPLLLKTQDDRPFGLFGYVLLLDAGLLTLGRKLRSPHLGALSLAGTVLIQALWIHGRMGPERLFFGLGILALFALVFAFFPQLAGASKSSGWLVSQAGAIGFSIVFAVYLASRADLGDRLWPLALLLAILSAAAGWLGLRNEAPLFGFGAVFGSLAVVAVWLTQHFEELIGHAWELAFAAVGLTLVCHVFAEVRPDAIDEKGPVVPAAIAVTGFYLITIAAGVVARGVAPWPWLCAWVLLGAAGYRLGAFSGMAPFQLVPAVAIGFGASILHVRHAGEGTFPSWPSYFGVLVALASAAGAVAWTRRTEDVRQGADHAAAALTVIVTMFLSAHGVRAASPAGVLLTVLILSVLTLVAATRLESGAWYLAAVLGSAYVHWLLVMGPAHPPLPSVSGTVLLFSALSVACFSGWTLWARGGLAASPLALPAAAVAAAVWFLPMQRVFVARFGDRWLGVLPLALAAAPLTCVALARRLWPAGRAERRRALVWFSAVAICLATAAIPLQLEKEWITVAFALEGLGLLLLWRKLDHPGLKYFALLVLGAATVRLVFNPALLGYYPRSGVPVFNWILYTYLVPAAALIASARVLRPIEVARARPAEHTFYAEVRPLGAILTGLAAIAVVFVWLNLVVADWFTEGPVLTLTFGRSPARDLTLLIVWAVYAVSLLILGMVRSSVALRWLSLCFLVVTIGKVFLYDLGELKDLYRVASLVGLAVSLILVSLLYQRFVFRARAGRRSAKTDFVSGERSAE